MRVTNQQFQRTVPPWGLFDEAWVLGMQIPGYEAPINTSASVATAKSGMALNGGTNLAAVLTNPNATQITNVFLAFLATDDATWVVDYTVQYGPIPGVKAGVSGTVRLDPPGISARRASIVVSVSGIDPAPVLPITCAGTIQSL